MSYMIGERCLGLSDNIFYLHFQEIGLQCSNIYKVKGL